MKALPGLTALLVAVLAVGAAATAAAQTSASPGGSSNARGVTEGDLKGKPAEFATPSVLLRLAREHDRMFTY